MPRSGERSELTDSAQTIDLVLADLAASNRRIEAALSLTDDELGCTEWCRGEHCLYVITRFRAALAAG